MTLVVPSSRGELREAGAAAFAGPAGGALGDPRCLVRLRWAAVLGQLATFAVLCGMGAADLRIGPLLALEAAIIGSNLGLWALQRHSALLGRHLVGRVLVLDTFLLTALLAYSGGPMNPYTIFFLVQVAMAAVVLGGVWGWLIAGLSSACYGSLFLLTPVTPHLMHGEEFASHLYGMLSSFVIASACVSYFVWLVQRERQGAERRAAEASAAAARAESFAALTAVAASAAHELATPLATIAVAARELERSAGGLANAAGLAGDARLIREEVDRCRRILDALSPRFPAGDDVAPVCPREFVAELLERVAPALRARIKIGKLHGSPVRLAGQRAGQAAAALLQNALDAGPAAGTVALECETGSEGLVFRVHDTGPGMPATVQARLGEPFFTTKPHGCGLGLFLVRQFVEHAAGRLVIESRESAPAGTRVTMIIPPIEETR